MPLIIDASAKFEFSNINFKRQGTDVPIHPVREDTQRAGTYVLLNKKGDALHWNFDGPGSVGAVR
jgi:hypothetical protein